MSKSLLLSEFSKSVKELINDNKLLIMDELFIVKAKDRHKMTRNENEIIIRTEM